MRTLILVLFLCFGGKGFAQDSFTTAAESVLTIAGTSTVHDWEVVAQSIKGSLSSTEETISDLRIDVAVAEIKSERGPTMDNKMYSALKSEAHPTITFYAEEFNTNGYIKGILSVAGIEKEIEVQIELGKNDDMIRVSGAYSLLFEDYDMKPPTAMFGQIVVGETVRIKFDLIFFME